MKNNFFRNDIFILLLVSILLSALVAKGISLGANLYFQETLTSLTGDYGEYDLLVQVREESREEGKIQMQQMLETNFPGSKFKEAPSIGGKANFFIALPPGGKTKEIYENIDRLFSAIYGVTGVSIITEPRLSIRGVPNGAVDMMMKRFEAIDGVTFVYRLGASIGIVLEGVDKIAAATEQVENELNSYQVLEVNFPAGAEAENPVRLAGIIVDDITEKLHPTMLYYVSIDEKADEMAYAVSTMQEMRKFFLAYMTKITIYPEESGKIRKGDLMLLQGTSIREPQIGDDFLRGNVIAIVEELNNDGTAQAVITQGDSEKIKDHRIYKIEGEKVQGFVGKVEYQNPRIRLANAIEKAAGLFEKVPDLAKDTVQVSKTVRQAIDGYNNNSQRLEKTLNRMNDAVAILNKTTIDISSIDVKGVKNQLESSINSIKTLHTGLKLIQIFNADVTSSIQALEVTQNKLENFQQLLTGMDEMHDDAVKAQSVLNGLTQEGKGITEILKSINHSSAENNLVNLETKLTDIAEADLKQAATELRYMAASIPNMKDEEIYASVKLLDKLMAGHFSLGQRLQFLLDRNIALTDLKPIVIQAVGHESVGVLQADLGVIEPNIYLQVYQVLNEVQAVLAGLTALVLTLVLLALDHTSIMAALKMRIDDKKNGFFTADKIYGMALGAILLSTIFLLAGGGIPYVPFYMIPIIGALLGIFMDFYSEKISPIEREEILAAESLGMSFDEIMREIVIPNARPGLLQKLNRRRLLFK